MKTIMKILMVCCLLVSQLIAAPSDESKIRAQFQKVLWATDDRDAAAYMATMHPQSIKTWAEHLSLMEQRYGRAVGEDAVTAPEAYVTRLLSAGFRDTTNKFSFSKLKSMRVHGVVMDQGLAFVLYSTEWDEDESLKQPATLTFRQDHGVWKLWGIPLSKLIVDTWPEAAKPEEAPQDQTETIGSGPQQ